MKTTYQSRVITEGGIYLAVVMDSEWRVIDQKNFATKDEALAFVEGRIRLYSGRFQPILEPINRIRAMIFRLRYLINRARTKNRYKRDEVL